MYHIVNVGILRFLQLEFIFLLLRLPIGLTTDDFQRNLSERDQFDRNI